MGLMDFFSHDAGQKRRKWLDQTLGENMHYYLGGTGLDDRAAALSELNPVRGMENAGTAGRTVFDPSAGGMERLKATGDMVSNMAGVLAPAGAAKGAGKAADALTEALTGMSAMPRAVVGDFAADQFGGMKLFPGQSVDDALRAKYPQAKISVSGGPDRGYTLNQVVLPKEERGKGLGSSIMRDLIETADDQGARVALSPSADFGGSVARLREFYKRFGFVQNQGKNKDFGISESMYRAPKPTDPQREQIAKLLKRSGIE